LRISVKLRHLWANPYDGNGRNTVSDLDFLAKVPIFDSLSRRQREMIHSLIHVRNYSPGEIVVRQEDPGVGLYIIREGAVSVWFEHPDLTRTLLASLSDGDFFGEIALLNEIPRSATVVAEKPTVLFGFFRSDLLSIMETNPETGAKIVYRLAQIVAERIRRMNVDVADVQ
jgi:CRP-like cAMP-binding protein